MGVVLITEDITLFKLLFFWLFNRDCHASCGSSQWRNSEKLQVTCRGAT